MADSRVLQLIISAENKANAAFKQIDDALEGHEKRIKNITEASKKVAAVGAVAFGAIVGEVALATKAYAESESQLARVDQTLRNVVSTVGGNFSQMSDRAREFGAQLQAIGGIGDEAGAEGFAKMLMVSGGDMVEASKLATLAADLATAKQIDYATAVKTVSMTVAGNTKVLKEYGITLDENATSQEALAALTASVDGQYRTFGQTIEGQSAIMKQSLGDLQENIGKALLPVIQKVIEAITPLINKFVEWTGKNPELVSKIVLIAGAVAALITVVGTLGAILPAIIAGFTFIASPIGLIVIGIMAVIAAGIALYTHWDAVKAKAIEVWTAVKDFFLGIWQTVTTAVTTVWTAIKDFFAGIWEAIKLIFLFQLQLIVGLVLSVFDAMGIDLVAVFKSIGEFFTEFWNDLTSAFTWAINGIKLIWDTVWTAIRDVLGPVWLAIKTAVNEALGWVSNKFKEWTAPLSKAWSALWSSFGGTVETMWEGVKNSIKSGINWIIGKINFVIDAVNKVMAKGAGALGISPIQIPTIPALANGGIVNKPTLAMIGEAGPEAVIPLNRGLAGAGGLIIQISGNNIYGEEDFVDKFGKKLIGYIQENIKIS